MPSDGVVFRHQQNASMNGGEDAITGERSGRLGAFFAYRNTFDESSVWVDVPKDGASYFAEEMTRIKINEAIHLFTVTFYNVIDPYNMEATPEPEQLTDSSLPATTRDVTDDTAHNRPSFEEAPGLEALSTAATTNMEYMRQLSVPLQSPRGINTPQHSVNNIDFILNPTGPEGRLSKRNNFF